MESMIVAEAKTLYQTYFRNKSNVKKKKKKNATIMYKQNIDRRDISHDFRAVMSL